MLDVMPQNTIEMAPPLAAVRQWGRTTRVAFRFCFVYFTGYVFTTQMLGGLLVFLKWEVPPLEELPPVRNFVTWIAVHVFRISRPLVISGSGSGDKTFNWIAAFCLLVVACIGTATWAALDRRRSNYASLHKWFHLFLRFAAGSTMLVYGMVKVFPLQMPAPFLTRLVEPFGEFSPMGVLWASIGASPAYERFAGGAELAAAACLFVPKLWLVGALILLADSIQIFTLNMTYDVPVKLFSFHLILMSLVLLAPEWRRLSNVLVLNRTAGPSEQTPLFHGLMARRMATVAQIALGICLIGVNVASARRSWYSYGGGAPKPPLYGIWDVDTMLIDETERAALLTDSDRWRRLIVQNANGVSFQAMDGRLVFYGSTTDETTKTITLRRPGNLTRLNFDRADPTHLSINGEIDGRNIRVALHLLDHSKFLLFNRGFNWIQEYPFNR